MPITLSSGPYSLLEGNQWPSGSIPSGYPGSQLLAYLISLRATFGFNSQEHTFDLSFASSGLGHGHGSSGQLAPINTPVGMWVSGFFVSGLISHIDWDSSSNGTIM